MNKYLPFSLKNFWLFMFQDMPVEDIQYLTDSVADFEYERNYYRMYVVDYLPGDLDVTLRLDMLVGKEDPHYVKTAEKEYKVRDLENFISLCEEGKSKSDELLSRDEESLSDDFDYPISENDELLSSETWFDDDEDDLLFLHDKAFDYSDPAAEPDFDEYAENFA